MRLRKWVLNGQTNAVNEDIDQLRSQRYAYVSLTSTSQSALLAPHTGKTLYLDTLIVNNDNTSAVGTLILYDSTSTTTPVMKLTVGANESVILTDLKGPSFTTGIYPLQGSTHAMQITVGCIEADT